MLEGIDAGGGDDPGLAHGAAPLLLEAPGLSDEVAAAREGGTHGRAQTLGEVDPDCVEGLGIGLGGDTALHNRIEKPCAVHVELEPEVARGLRDILDALEGPDRAATEVRGLLDLDEARARCVAAFRTHGRAEL